MQPNARVVGFATFLGVSLAALQPVFAEIPAVSVKTIEPFRALVLPMAGPHAQHDLAFGRLAGQLRSLGAVPLGPPFGQYFNDPSQVPEADLRWEVGFAVRPDVRVHDHAAERGSPGIAYETLDMVRANKLGLVVVDGTMAMEGNGPTQGTLVPMDVIVAGTNALATDMVAASIMGFEPQEVPTFVCAQRVGMTPVRLAEVEIRGASIEKVRRRLARPRMYTRNEIRGVWGTRECAHAGRDLEPAPSGRGVDGRSARP